MSFAVRSAGDPSALVPDVRAAIREVDPNLPIFELTTQADLASRRLSVERRLASLSSGAGLLALFLTCLALYGTLSYRVARRTREIGIRMALGAPRRGVVRSVVREVLILVSLGLIAGLPVAHLSSYLVSDQLYTVEATSIGVRLVAMAAMLAIAAAAAYLPARRASQVDPVVALGAE
jgi:ABC-type antimicrobial peptide transport system permease subunit